MSWFDGIKKFFSGRQTMKKGAWIRVAVWVEGEAEPTHDFGKTALEAVKNSFKLMIPAAFANLKIEVRSVWEDSDPPPDMTASGEEKLM